MHRFTLKVSFSPERNQLFLLAPRMLEELEKSESKCCGTCGCREVAAVTPRIDSRIGHFLSDPSRLFDLMKDYGSPLNIVFPQAVIENHARFTAILKESGVPGEVLFTSKPNKSTSILRALAQEGARIDVSSEGALRHALKCGISGNRIQASGPKPHRYILAALKHSATVSVDCREELESIRELLQQDAQLPNASIVIRISGFESDRIQFTSPDTPFGIRMSSLPEVLSLLVTIKDRITFRGLHFHLLGGGAHEERLVAFENAIDGISQAFRLGLRPQSINIGGGFKIQYAANSDEWQRFQNYLRASVLGKVDSVIWDGLGLGFRAENGKILGTPSFEDHAPKEAGAQALQSFLKMQSSAFNDVSVAELVKDMLIELQVEPGRALLDQAGITVAEVIAVKESARGRAVITLDINQTNLNSREQKLLTQPIVISRENRPSSSKSYFLFGNLCTSSDLLQPQKIYPGFEPRRGDAVIFINTAAYHMDYCESEVLYQRVAKKIAAYSTDSGFSVVEDDALGEDTK